MKEKIKHLFDKIGLDYINNIYLKESFEIIDKESQLGKLEELILANIAVELHNIKSKDSKSIDLYISRLMGQKKILIFEVKDLRFTFTPIYLM